MAPVAAPSAPERKSRGANSSSAAAPSRAPERKGRSAKSSGSAAPSRAQRNQRAIASARATQRAGTAAPASRTAAPARRKSGAAPAPARRKTAPAAAPRKTAASPVARVLNSRGMPFVDRVLRGPVWVVMLGALLAGIVFLNVSVLQLNRGIARTDAKSAALERTNSGLRERVAKLDSGERIQQLAAARGFVLPQPGEVTFIRPRRSDARLAAARITAPDGAASTTPGAAPVAASTATTTQTGYTTGAEPSVTGGGAVTPVAAPTSAATPTSAAAPAATTATPAPTAAPTAATTTQGP